MLRFSPNPNSSPLIHWIESEDDAFRKAREQDRPVMLFLSAFWCRYCQSMDEAAFSDRENMALLNAYFVALRVDNAKRPDIDARYNLNGWPTIAFLTPNGKLLAAANYLPSDEFKEFPIGSQKGDGRPAVEIVARVDVGPFGIFHPQRDKVCVEQRHVFSVRERPLVHAL